MKQLKHKPRTETRLSVPLPDAVRADLEAARRDLEAMSGCRLSLGQAAQSLIRRGLIERSKAA